MHYQLTFFSALLRLKYRYFEGSDIVPFTALLLNASVAFTGFYLISKLYHSEHFGPFRFRGFLIGLLTGAIGLFLMMNAVQVNGEVRVDLRYLPLVLLAFYGARFPLLIATMIVASTRFLFGVTDQAVIAFIATFIVSVGMWWIHRHIHHLLWQSMLLHVWALFVTSVSIFINLGWDTAYIELVLTFWTVGLLVGTLASLLAIDLEKATQRAKAYKHSAERDHLTGLFNRRMWEERTLSLVSERRTYNILALDIDHFKHVNDTYGHPNGDLVLKRFAELLKIETRAHDIVARIGGEEFVILIYDLSPEKVAKVAERIRKRIAAEAFTLSDGTTIQISVSIGIAHGNALPVESMSSLADTALYEAKDQGRNRTVVRHANAHRLIPH
ncbi:diguanylate cyclase [Exiguobacterium himgiriensis]|nr:diguanylate cyclase [Exiguobacterium himgiriensis]